MTQDYSISWDPSLPPFAGPGSELPEFGYAVEAMADGTNFGNPEALLEVVKSLLTEGSLAVLEGWDNRVAPIRLRLSAPTAIAGPALAQAEKALMLAVTARIKAPLVYVPPAQDAVTCVFDVVAAKLERDVSDEWDLEEVQREYRYYLLTLTCLPFARTEESVVVPALDPDPSPSIPPVFTTIDDCSTFTNWATSFEGVVSPTSGAVDGYVHATGRRALLGSSVMRLTMTLPAPVPGPFLVLDVHKANYADFDSWIEIMNGSVVQAQVAPSSSRPSPIAANATRYMYDVSALGLVAGQKVRLTSRPNSSSTTGSLRVHHVSSADKMDGGTSTTRQLSRIAAVEGSAPTQAAIRLYDATPATLGRDVLIYTSSNADWNPALRAWMVTTGGVADADAVSGTSNYSVSEPVLTYRIPAAMIAEGTYALVGRLYGDQGTLSWSARIVGSAGAEVVGSGVVTSGSVELPASAALETFEVHQLGVLSLPVVAAEADQMIELSITVGASRVFDEAWLFSLTDGALTWVSGASEDLTWLEIRSPELGAARPSVYGGTGALGSGSVCVDWACESFGAHRFDPGLIQVFTVTSDSLVSQSELEFYPRYHSHVEGSRLDELA